MDFNLYITADLINPNPEKIASFVGGDIKAGAATIVKAVCDGKKAADQIHQMLKQMLTQKTTSTNHKYLIFCHVRSISSESMKKLLLKNKCII